MITGRWVQILRAISGTTSLECWHRRPWWCLQDVKYFQDCHRNERRSPNTIFAESIPLTRGVECHSVWAVLSIWKFLRIVQRYPSTTCVDEGLESRPFDWSQRALGSTVAIPNRRDPRCSNRRGGRMIASPSQTSSLPTLTSPSECVRHSMRSRISIGGALNAEPQ